jgi:hypothetical protein
MGSMFKVLGISSPDLDVLTALSDEKPTKPESS